jgi:hypothetical protein
VVAAFSEMYSVLFTFRLVLGGRAWEDDLEVVGVLLAMAERCVLFAVEEALEDGCR